MRSMTRAALLGAIAATAGTVSAEPFLITSEVLVDNSDTIPGTSRTYNILSTPAADGMDAVFFGQTIRAEALQARSSLIAVKPVVARSKSRGPIFGRQGMPRRFADCLGTKR